MSFLHGVLSGVKDDDNVITYNEYIGEENKLNKVLDTLTSSIGTGRNGLSLSVNEVKEWLGKYNGEVEKKTGAVTGGLGELIDKLSSGAGKNDFYQEVNEHNELSTQLMLWTGTLGKIAKELKNIETQNVNVLDSALKSRIMHEIKPIQKSVEVLLGAAKEEGLQSKVKEVDQALMEEEKKLKRALLEQIFHIRANVTSLNNSKETQIGHVNSAVKRAQAFLPKAFDERCKKEIIWHFDNIKEHVNDIHNSLTNKKIELGALVADAQRYFGEIKSNIGGHGFEDTIYGGWSMLKTKMQNFVKELNGVGPGDGGAQADGIFDKIVKGIKKYAERFKTNGINDGSFGEVVQEWLTGILGSKAVTAALGEYVKDDKKVNLEALFNKLEEGIPAVAKAIVGELKQEISQAVAAAVLTAMTGENEVEKSVNAVNAACVTFAGRLEERITKEYHTGSTDTKFTFFAAIATAMETAITSSAKKTTTKDKSLLAPTIEFVLSELIGAARQAGNAVYSFAGEDDGIDDDDNAEKYNLGKHLEAARSKIGDISKQFNDKKDLGLSPEDYGNLIDDSLKRVAPAITHLITILHDASGSLPKAVEKLKTEVLTKLDTLKNGKESDGSVEKGKNVAETLIDDLKIDFKHKLNAIAADVSNVNHALNTAIQELRSTITEAHKKAENAVSQAFATLTSEVRALFAQGHKADLAALKTLVDGQEKEIDKIIRHDKSNGVKGLLKWMSSNKSTLEEIQRLVSPSPAPAVKPQGNTEDRTKLKNVSDKFREYSDIILDYIGGQARNPSAIVKPTEQSLQVGDIKDAFDRLIKYVAHHDDNKYTFDHISTSYLDALNASLLKLSPSHFHGFHNPLLLDALKSGMTKFTEQLSHAYVNKYSGQKPKDRWAFDGYQVDTRESKRINEFTEEGRKAARVFLSILRMMYENLYKLQDDCGGKWRGQKLCEDENDEKSLGGFLKRLGYKVAKNQASKDGELKLPLNEYKGENIYGTLKGPISGAATIPHITDCLSPKKSFNVLDILLCLTTHLHQYFRIGHITIVSSPRNPCSVYEMLVWCSGLEYNAIYDKLTTYCSEYDTKQDSDLKQRVSDAVHYGLPSLGNWSHNLLTTILGTGDASTYYASDYYNNSLRLGYPTSGADCLRTLVDIFRRLFPVFRFMYGQCGLGSRHHGWAGCQYGKNIPTTKWPCNVHSADKSKCQPKCEPNCQANDQPSCQPTSPLQCYLTDSLIGHLPHDVTSIGCKTVCNTCPKSMPGMPCITPMGFRGFSSSTRRGKELCNVLGKFLGNDYLTALFYVAAKPPSNLPEHFGFVKSLVSGIKLPLAPKHSNHTILADAFVKSASEQSIDLYKNTSDLTDALTKAYGSSVDDHQDKDHLPGLSNLSSLAMTTPFHYLTEDARNGALDDIDARRISLGTLAGQLSGFIGGSEEVKKAIVKGLHSNVNELEKRLQASCGGKGCNCNIKSFRDDLKNLQDTFKKYDDLETKINGLKKQKDIAEKSEAPVGTPSDSESEIERLTREIKQHKDTIFSQSSPLKDQITSVIDAVQSKITALDSKKKKVVDAQRQVNDLKKEIDAKQNNDVQLEDLKNKLNELEKKLNEAKNNFPEKESKSLDSHQSSKKSLGTLKELCDFAEKIDQKSDNTKNLLENLCTGLENFLGYHDGNYTGEGIVYSDLDRLCDGVMSFLHGVLQSLRDDPSVSTYSFISQKDLNKILEHMHRGDYGFRVCIDHVNRVLHDYDDELNKRTDNVNKSLSELSDHLGNKYVTQVNEKISEPLEKQLTAWRTTVQSLETEVNKIQTEKINVLDSSLRNTIMHEFVSVKSVVEHMRSVSLDPALMDQAKRVDDELVRQRWHVANAIHTESERVQSSLDTQFRNVEKNISNLKRTKIVHFDALNEAVRVAKEHVEEYHGEFDYKHKNAISRHFDDIKKYLEMFVNKTSENTTLQTKFKSANEMVTTLEENVKRDLNSLKGKIEEEMNRYVNKYVKEVQSKVNIIKGWVGENGISQKSGIIGSWEGIKAEITRIIAEIYNKEAKTEASKSDQVVISGNLGNIFNHVKWYAGLFSQQNFKSVVKGWITRIFKDNGIVKHWLGEYIKAGGNKGQLADKLNKSEKEFNDETIGSIAKHIRDKLDSDVITPATQKFKGKPGDDITSNLQYVRDACTTFAAELDEKLKDPSKGITASTISSNILDNVLNSAHTGNRELQEAVHLTLIALSSTATGVAKTLEKFTTPTQKNNFFNLGLNLQLAIGDVEKIKTALGDGKNGETGSRITKTLSAVGKQIKELHDNLDTATAVRRDTTVTPYSSADQPTPSDNLENKIKGILNLKVGPTSGDGSKIEKTFGEGDFMTQFNTANETLKSAVEQIRKQLDSLKHVPDFVDTQKGNAEGLMDRIREKIYILQLNIVSISGEVNKADVALDKAIEGLFSSLNSAYSMSKQAVQDLQTTLTDTTEQAFNKITIEVKILFANQHKADLTALKASLDTQIPKVKTIINEALRSGVRGLLQAMNCHKINLEEIKNVVTTSTSENSEKFRKACEHFQQYFTLVNKYLEGQSISQPKPKNVSTDSNLTKLSTIHSALQALLSHLSTQKHFDHQVPGMLQKLKTSVQALHSTAFANPAYPVLDAFPKSLERFVEQLERGYVNRYDGRTWNDTIEDKHCAKIFCTLTPMLLEGLVGLKGKCTDGGSWGKKQINLSIEDRYKTVNPLGAFLHGCGFLVSKLPDSHEGELRNKENCTGNTIGGLIAALTLSPTGNYNLLDIVHGVSTHVDKYNEVCHLETFTSTKIPCSIHDILIWFSGLPYNAVYSTLLRDGFTSLLQKPKPKTIQGSDEFEVELDDLNSYYIDAYPNKFTYKNIDTVLNHICSKSHDVLTTIAGTGDANTVYASDYCNNSFKFKYPTSGEDCLHTLLDMLRRLLPTLRYLYNQCRVKAEHYGWCDCKYGKGIPMAKSQCTEHPSDESTCRPNGQPSSQPECQPNTKVDCQPTSPLQSYLSDCLVGCLPHQLTSVGCKSVCLTCPRSKPGMPCLTPLGFRGFSGSTRTGRDLRDMISEFFNVDDLTCLFSLVPKPPATLPEHFAFTLSFVDGWDTNGRHHVLDKTRASITNRSIELYKDPNSLTNALRKAYGNTPGEHSKTHSNGNKVDLSTLSLTTSCNGTNHCVPYLSTLKNVLDSEYFKDLFRECDEFLKQIREPFSLTLLALWSLSLLYLLHIAVVRLDVLRIRSHLRSPSSHRIAAQSLLAAARVKALANVKYFSP
ncbi:hypothetical protein, conserved [Babesia ovata]|uniref:Extracellular matrix-binding ebh n=1 Tax=Babesia ovata TaxID=189622 RepID=A0A2H6KJG8_9APIC|nr:uncharacterized protein BOVATA_046270 [Babesia ovata]GBE63134.1 hypothetical protein, conserved [Babesia ovata]